MNRITFILLSLLLAWRIECQGENTTTANRLAVAEENFDDNEGVEEAKPGTKPEAMTDSEGDNCNEVNGSNASRIILATKMRTDGTPGWIEKVLRKVETVFKEKGYDSMNRSRELTPGSPIDIQLDEEITSGLFKKLIDIFLTLGPKATGAWKGLAELKEKWNTLSFGDRAVMTQTLQSAASNIDKFAKAGDDTIGAIRGALNMVGQFEALAGPTGQNVAVGPRFVSGLLSLFGVGGKKKKSIGQIAQEEIDQALAQFPEPSLFIKTSEHGGLGKQFDVLKAYVDRVAQSENNLTVAQAESFERKAPLYIGVALMGALTSEIERLLKANKEDEAKKTLRYIELYARMAVLEAVILQELAFLLPNKLEQELVQVIFSEQSQQKKLLKFLRAGGVDKIALSYFDPDVYPITDAYMTTVLKVPDYDRSLAGKWCLTPVIGRAPKVAITWKAVYPKLMAHGHPYITMAESNEQACFWKLIPHGNSLYTVVNTYGGPKHEFYGQYLSFDILHGYDSRMAVKSKAVLWEIVGDRQKRITSEWQCPWNERWCSTQPLIQYEFPGRENKGYDVITFGLSKIDVGYIWWITKYPFSN